MWMMQRARPGKNEVKIDVNNYSVDNSSVYTAFDLGRVVEFHTIFPRCAMPKISKCLRGFRRDQMFGGFLANLVNKVVNKPFYNPNYHMTFHYDRHIEYF